MKTFARGSPSAPQGPVPAPRKQHSEVMALWVCDELYLKCV